MTDRILAQGGFNSGRMYQPTGQLIYWWLAETGAVTFYDRSRCIIGEIREIASGSLVDDMKADQPSSRVARWLMLNYDANAYDMACQPGRIPDDFDFGPTLRI